jgi:malate dehydrogenase (oxaloacetate-decarboxylating)
LRSPARRRRGRPTALIGYTAKRGLFDEKILRGMAENDPRPAIFALSNPTSKRECTPEEALAANGGRALVATGMPFPPVRVEERSVPVSQCNNL